MEFLLSTIFMLALSNALLSDISNILGFNYFGASVQGFIIILSIISWLISLFKKPVHILLMLFTFIGIATISELITPGVINVIFNFGSGSLSAIGQSNFVLLFGLCLPLFVLCYVGDQLRIDKLLRYLYYYSILTTLLFSIVMLLNIMGISEDLEYMNIAYSALPGIFILFFHSKVYHSKFSSMLWIIGAVFVLLGGSRGAFLTLLLMIFSWSFVNRGALTAKKFVIRLILIILCVLIILNLHTILTVLDGMLSTFGYSSRLINKAMGSTVDGELLGYDDRSIIQEKIIYNLNLFGHGIYSDRLVLLDDDYPHNIVLEIFYQYGVLLGCIILLLLTWMMVSSFQKFKKGSNMFYMFSWICLFSIIIGKMMFSSSYLIDRSFWFFAGLVVLSLNKRTQSCNFTY